VVLERTFSFVFSNSVVVIAQELALVTSTPIQPHIQRYNPRSPSTELKYRQVRLNLVFEVELAHLAPY
jgi:hypothetical protein